MSYNVFRSLLLLFTALNSISAAPTQDYAANARDGLTSLQQWYNLNTGIWNSTGWWNSANCLTMLGDFAAVDPSVNESATSVFANSLVQAQNYNLGETKVITEDFNMRTIFDSNVTINPKGFLNGFYDDEGWWALGWIQAYDVTGDPDYLDAAVDIFNDMMNGTEPKCGGGIWWDKANTYVNAIANELYLSVASHLANRIPSNKTTYVNIAEAQWNWFQNSGMINSKNTINDGLTKTCVNNNGTVWSYNQGVILGALVELNKAAPNSTYLPTASKIAQAAISALSDSNGILHDPCEPNCGGDGTQFKGIFMRNLQKLQTAAPNNDFLSFIAANAASIWSQDKNGNNQFSVNWAGPFVGTANASTQSSAMDALVAASAFQKDLTNGIVSIKI